MSIRTLIVILLCLPGCAALTTRPKPVCIATGLAAGLAASYGLMIGAVAMDCGPQCEQQKIRLGETVHDTTLHHIEQRNAIIELGGPMAFVGFGLGGYAVCMEVLS
jgi:hypothetical protein